MAAALPNTFEALEDERSNAPSEPSDAASVCDSGQSANGDEDVFLQELYEIDDESDEADEDEGAPAHSDCPSQ